MNKQFFLLHSVTLKMSVWFLVLWYFGPKSFKKNPSGIFNFFFFYLFAKNLPRTIKLPLSKLSLLLGGMNQKLIYKKIRRNILYLLCVHIGHHGMLLNCYFSQLLRCTYLRHAFVGNVHNLMQNFVTRYLFLKRTFI